MISIAVDLDSTLNNFDVVWINDYNKIYNDNLTIEDMISWNAHEYVKCDKKVYDIYKKKIILES